MTPSGRWVHRVLSHLFWALLFFLLFVYPVRADLLVLEVVVNDSSKGEFFVDRDAEGRIWLPVDNIAALGLVVAPRRTVERNGRAYFSLEEFPQIVSRFDEPTLSLRVESPPQYLPETDLDLSTAQHRLVLRSDENSAFFNYQLGIDHDSRLAGDRYGIETEAGLRRRGWLVLSGQRLEEGDGVGSGMSRLMTSAQYEWRSELKRLTLGDVLAPGDTLAPSVRLAGVTLSKNFELDPQFVQYPTLEYSGSVSTPAEIDIYLNELKIRSEKIPPGNFRLENFTGMMGYGDIEVVVRDSYGRETRMKSPYYLTNRLLKPGLSEYSFSFGLLREGYATKEDGYASPVLLGSQRYGWRRDLTIGYRFYADDALLLLTPQADLLATTYGLLSLVAGYSNEEGRSGAGTTGRYTFNRRPYTLFVNLGLYSNEFATAAELSPGDRPRTLVGGGCGWGTPAFGSLSFEVSRQQQQNDQQRNLIGVTYHRRLFSQVTLSVSSHKMEGDTTASFAYLSLDYTPMVGPKLSARYEGQRETRTFATQVEQNAPTGPGYGYRAEIGRQTTDVTSATFLASSAELKRDYGIYSGDVRIDQGGEGSETAMSISAAGALTWVGGVWRAARPVRDSFVLVQTGTLEGVEISHNGQVVGRTDHEGFLVLPEIQSYYDNQVALNDRDIPFNYSLSEVDRYLSPPARSGSCLPFVVEKSRPVTGRLHCLSRGESRALEYREIELTNLRGEKLTLPTGQGGEFYFDPRDFKPAGAALESPLDCRSLLRAGEARGGGHESYTGFVWSDSRRYSFTLQAPPGDEIYVDLGVVEIVMEGADNAKP